MATEKELDGLELEENSEEGVGGTILSIVIGIVILLILLGSIALFIKLDIGGLGSGVLRQYLKDVPVVNRVLPDVTDNQIAEEKGYRFNNISEAMNYIKQLESKIKTLEKSNQEDSKKISELQAEVERLKVFENQQEEFAKRVKEFDTKVVFNEKAPELAEYKAYYEKIAPDHAAKLYEQVLERLQVSEIVKQQAERYMKMEPATAAAALEVMTADLDLVVDILTNMPTSKAALIMQEMEADYCAKVTKKMSLLDDTTSD